MSFFKTKGIILALKKKEGDDTLYTLFSFDYGKILIQKKQKTREKPLDIGYVIQCEIVTQESKTIHKIKNIKIISQFMYEQQSFSVIHAYLNLIALIKKLTPNGVPARELYQIVASLHKIKHVSETKIILGQLKALHIFGLLKYENSNPLIQKILKFIYENDIETLYKLKDIDENLQKILKSLIVG